MCATCCAAPGGGWPVAKRPRWSRRPYRPGRCPMPSPSQSAHGARWPCTAARWPAGCGPDEGGDERTLIMNMPPRQLLLSLGAALVAALAAVLLAAQWNAQTHLDTRKIAVAAVDIQPGTRLRADLLQLVDWPAGSAPHGASGIVAALEGRVTRSALLRGEPLQESRLAEPGATGGLSAMVAQGKRAMTVRV
ncbi:MAG: Flp pilus assembly protein CpaB, partial [Oxalobacteraceae bacterium]